MEALFPEAQLTLRDADPELYDIIEDEKERQWCVWCPIGLGGGGRQRAPRAPPRQRRRECRAGDMKGLLLRALVAVPSRGAARGGSSGIFFVLECQRQAMAICTSVCGIPQLKR